MTRRRRSRRLIYGALIAAMLLLVPVSYVLYRLGLRPAATSGAAQTFRVEMGENAPLVATHLKAAGLIRNRNAFITYVNLHGLRPRLKVGTYMLAPTESGSEIAEDLAGGKTLTRRLVVPEGYRLSQIEAEAATIGISKDAFAAALVAPHTQSFLAGKPANVDLEGYLFPDSYNVGTDTTPAQLVNAMLDNFGHRVGPEYVQAFAAQGLSLHQGLTLASIVEREVNIPADRPVVAQIFLTRLKSGMSLGSDVTACYAYELQTGASKCDSSLAINIDSHYNTRKYPGLPPGPICSPGLPSLDAVAHPAATNYVYFFSDKNGKDHFEHTYPEQQRDVAKYGLAGQ